MTAPASVSMLLLRNVPLFSTLPEHQLAVLTGLVSRKSFPRGASIIAAGDITESLYVVISGRMKVMMSDDEGREVILAILGSNDFFGEMGLIDDHPRSASVVALEACEVLSLAKRDFKKCLAENFEMAMTVMRGLVKRLREADQKIGRDRKSTRLNSSHLVISYAVFCLKKKKNIRGRLDIDRGETD